MVGKRGTYGEMRNVYISLENTKEKKSSSKRSGLTLNNIAIDRRSS
jgi:hypothetical protein